MATLSPATQYSLVLQLVLLLIIVYRQYRIYRGVPVSAGRIAFGAGVLLLLFAVLEITGYFAVSGIFPGLGLAILANLAIVIVTALVAIGWAARRAEIWKSPGGTWMYRMGLAPAILYVVLYFARLGLEAVFLPSLLNYTSGTLPTGIDLLQLIVLEVVTALLAISTGILVGRGIGVYQRYLKLRQSDAQSPPSGPPLPSQGSSTPPSGS